MIMMNNTNAGYKIKSAIFIDSTRVFIITSFFIVV